MTGNRPAGTTCCAGGIILMPPDKVRFRCVPPVENLLKNAKGGLHRRGGEGFTGDTRGGFTGDTPI